MPELYANDIEAIAKAAFEAHTGERWDEQKEEGRCFWRDTVPYAVAPRDPAAGIPDVEAAIVRAYHAHFAAPSKPMTEQEVNIVIWNDGAPEALKVKEPALPKPKSDTKPTKFKK